MRRLKAAGRVRMVFFSKVTLLFVAALALVVACLVLFNLLFFRNAADDLSRRIRSQSHLSLEVSVENKLQEYAKIMYRLVTDGEVRRYLRVLDDLDAKEYSMAVNDLNEAFSRYAATSGDIIAVTMISREMQFVVYDRSRISLNYNIWPEDLASGRLSWMVEEAQAEKKVLFFADSRHIEGISAIHVVLGAWDYYSKENMGAVVVTVDASALWKLISSGAAEQSAFDFLALADGSILVHPDYSMTGMPIEGYALDGPGLRLVSQPEAGGGAPFIPDKAEITVQKVDGFDVYLISVLDPSMYGQVISQYSRVASCFVVLIAAAVILIYLVMLRHLMESVRSVIAGIETARSGNLKVRIVIRRRDEIYHIAEALNSTLESLETISRERDQEFLRFLRESERRRKAEVRALESQINSHFLYNTLNAINYTAMEGDSLKTSRLIKSLALCLRYTLDKQWDLVTVREEMEWLERYLLLQKERQPSLFRYEIDAAPDTLSLPLRKLIIQPFVENAIMHGFSGQGSNHSLRITVRRRENPDRIAVAIYDDGAGIPPGKLEEIRNLLRNYEAADGLGIGLENVCFRLKTHYKSRARLYIRSREGLGTKINLVIDLAEGE